MLVLISTYDGDLGTLKGLIEAAEADEYVRTAALAALAYRQLYQAADLS